MYCVVIIAGLDSQAGRARVFYHPGFAIKTKVISGKECVIASFYLEDFPVKIFGQAMRVEDQLAYRHLIIEDQILPEHGKEFRIKVIAHKHEKP